jgi:hypothetical protein
MATAREPAAAGASAGAPKGTAARKGGAFDEMDDDIPF